MARRTVGRPMAWALAAGLAGLATPSMGAGDVGVTTLVKNEVAGRLSEGGEGSASHGPRTPLYTGDAIYQDQLIETGAESSAELMFRDETVLSVGSTARVVIDEFVYDPDQAAGDIVLNTAKGAFRFVSGSAKSESYKITTPIGTMGVRGTIIEWAYEDNMLVVILREGGTTICLASEACQTLDQPGTYIVTDGSSFSGVRKYKGEGGELILEGGDLDLLMSFLGGQRSFFASASGGPGGSPLPAPVQPPAPPPVQPPAQPPAPPPVQPPSFGDGFAPLLTGAGTVPGGLERQFESGSPPPGLVKNRDAETFRPPGQQ